MTETVVVVSTVVLLAVFGVPGINSLLKSFESAGSTEATISAAFASARAIAAKEQRYVGVRFQKAYDPRGVLDATQYMIFIVHDPATEPNGTDLANGFRAIEGLKPIKLPDTVGVMDLRYRTNTDPRYSGDEPIDEDSEINMSVPEKLIDTSTFSVVFSPSGKLVIHEVRVRNKNGQTNNTSVDDVFNTVFNVEAGKRAMFYQDDYTNLGLGEEWSRSSFVIYEQQKFKEAYKRGPAYSGYLRQLIHDKVIYINPYTGTIIGK